MPLIRRDVAPTEAGWFGHAVTGKHSSHEEREREARGWERDAKVEAGAGGRVSGGLADVTELAAWRHDPNTRKSWPATHSYSTLHHEVELRRQNRATEAAHSKVVETPFLRSRQLTHPEPL